MILDFHTHVQMPEQQAHPIWRGRCPMTIENVLEAQKEGGVDCTLVSQAMHQLREILEAREQSSLPVSPTAPEIRWTN